MNFSVFQNSKFLEVLLDNPEINSNTEIIEWLLDQNISFKAFEKSLDNKNDKVTFLVWNKLIEQRIQKRQFQQVYWLEIEE